MQRTIRVPLLRKHTDPLLRVCSRGRSWLKVPLATPLSHGRGRRFPFPWDGPRRGSGTGHRGGGGFCGLLGEGPPPAGGTPIDSEPPAVSPGGEEYGQVGICLSASSRSQRGAYLASRSSEISQECLSRCRTISVSGTGVSPGRSVRTGPPIWVCCQQQVDSKLSVLGNPLGRRFRNEMQMRKPRSFGRSGEF